MISMNALTKLRELALAVSMANGVLRVELYRGRKLEDVERDYQEAVMDMDRQLKYIETYIAELLVNIKNMYKCPHHPDYNLCQNISWDILIAPNTDFNLTSQVKS